MQYASSLSIAVQRLILINGCTEYTLSFTSPSWAVPADYVHANSAANNACDIFHQNGGNVTWQDPASGTVDGVIEPLITGGLMVNGVGRDDADPNPLGQDHAELIFLSRVSRDVCLEINDNFSITNTGGEPPQYQFGSFIPSGAPLDWARFGWNDSVLYGVGNNIGTIYTPCGCEVFAKPTGCYQTIADDEGYYFYHSIIER